MRLHNTFSIALGLTFLVSFAIVAAIFYRSAVLQSQREALREARMILGVATAARTYNSDQVTPLLVPLLTQKFDPESVPAFATQDIMKRFNGEFPAYTYRETALDPTDLNDLPRAWETDVIERFRADPGLKELSGERNDTGQLLLYIARPIQITDSACLECHSEPKNAPATMLAAYGSSHGFGWKLNDVIGARFVVVPISERLRFALTNVLWFLIALGSVMIVAFLVAIVLVKSVIANPVQRMAAQAQGLSLGEPGAEELTVQGAGEFRTLAQAINRLHRSLRLALAEVKKTKYPDEK